MSLTKTKQTLLEAIENGTILSSICEIYVQEIRSDSKHLAYALAEFHNESVIDINELLIGAFREELQHDFFTLLHSYEAALPMFDCAPTDVVECICHLLEQIGNDFAVGGLFGAFYEFCKVDLERSKESLRFILSGQFKYYPLIANAIVASGDKEPMWALEQVELLVAHENSDIRWQAYSAVGRLDVSDAEFVESSLALLEGIGGQEKDGSVKSAILRSVILLGKKSDTLWARINDFIRYLISTVQPHLLHEVSSILAFDNKGFPQEIRQLFIRYLESTPADHTGTIDNIDYLLVDLLKQGGFEQAETLLASLLYKQEDLRVTVFNSFSQNLLGENKVYLNKLVTKWLVSGKGALYHAVHDLLHDVNSKDVELNADAQVFVGDETKMIFTARKVVGWLFARPIGAASFIISLYPQVSHSAKDELEELLFSPLLISYPGELSKFLEDKANASDTECQELCSRLLSRYESYLNSFKATCEVKELRAPQKNAELYWKEFNRSMLQAKDDGPKSIFEQICTVQHLLYGNSSIFYVHDGEGEKRRSEMQMHTISHSTEMPRMNVIDPEGLDYMLRAFRVERLKDETNS